MESFTVRKVFYTLFYAEEKRRSVIEKVDATRTNSESKTAHQCRRHRRLSTLTFSNSLPLIFQPPPQKPLADDDASLLRARVAALEAELQGMRLSSLMMTATASAAHPLSPPPLLPTSTTTPTPAAAAAAAASASSTSSASAASAAAAASHDDDDQPTALVPRAALELLKLKDQAMDSVLEGITIADARRPDMPLIYERFFFFFFASFFVE